MNNFEEYIDNQLTKDLKQMEYKNADKSGDYLLMQNYTLCFGENPEHLKSDVSILDNSNRIYFFLGLFMYGIIDLTLFTYYKLYYIRYRRIMKYPRYDWTKSEKYYSELVALIEKPVQYGIIDKEYVIRELPYFYDILKKKCKLYFEENINEISSENFIRSLINDQEFVIENYRGTVFATICEYIAERFEE